MSSMRRHKKEPTSEHHPPSPAEYLPGGQRVATLHRSLFEQTLKFSKNTSYALFEELFHFLGSTEKAFHKIRSTDHLLRIVRSLRWLREKQSIHTFSSLKTHLFCRIFRSTLHFDFGSREVISLVVSLSSLHSYERFSSLHMLRACCDIVPDFELVPYSYFSFRHPEDGTFSYYIEIERPDCPLSSIDFLALKKELKARLEDAIERIDHHLELPHNEEDTIRNSILLGQQVIGSDDPPQMIVQFQGQRTEDLEFLITYMRVVDSAHKEAPPEVHDHPALVRFELISSFIAGPVGNRFKQVSLFKVLCAKEPFFRIDFSIDFLKSREFVTHCVDEAFGKVRDLNGGVICLQYDLLNKAKKLLLQEECKDELLFEKFFSSLYPSSMKSLLEPFHITSAFNLFLSIQAKIKAQEMPAILCEETRREVYLGFESTCSLSQEAIFRIARGYGVKEHEIAISCLNIDGAKLWIIILLSPNSAVRAQFAGWIQEMIEKANTTAKSKQILRLSFCRPTLVLDPRVGADFISGIAIKMLYEGLTRLDPSGNPSLAAAERVDISPDGCRYTFTLRPSVWSNGMAVTAYDFEYGWKKVLDPSFATYSDYLFYPIKNARAVKHGLLPQDTLGVHSTDKRTLVVDLEHPAPYFLELCGLWIYSPLCHETDIHCPGWAFYAGKDYVSNGPFTLTSCDPKRHIHVARNERYWDKAHVCLDEIQISIIEDMKTYSHLFATGQLDWIGNPLTEFPADFHKENRQNIHARSIAGIKWVALNMDHTPFQSKKVRHALSLSLDRQAIIKKCLYGDERPSNSILPALISLLDPTKALPYDPPSARKLFDEGITELGIRRADIPQLEFLVSDRELYMSLANEVARIWEENFGISINVCSVKRKQFLSERCKSRHAMALMAWGSWYKDPYYSLSVLADVGLWVNPAKWADSNLAELLHRSDHAENKESREEYLRQAERFVMEEMPIIPICDSIYRYMQNESLEGVAFSIFGGVDFKWAKIRGMR
jgi:oligopeptide transport system substrate-binding protein